MAETAQEPAAPFRLVLEYDLWIWNAVRASEVAAQLAEKISQLSTDDRGAHGVHHRIVSLKVERG